MRADAEGMAVRMQVVLHDDWPWEDAGERDDRQRGAQDGGHDGECSSSPSDDGSSGYEGVISDSPEFVLNNQTVIPCLVASHPPSWNSPRGADMRGFPSRPAVSASLAGPRLMPNLQRHFLG